MPKYRVTTTIETTKVVEADNPFQAAVHVGGNVTDVRPARGRVAGASKPVKKVAKKRKPLSPEARARLAQNLVKARAARARNAKATKKATRKTATGEGGAATLKRIFKERDRIRLQPANQEMDPIYISAAEWDREWEQQGKVTAVYRRC